MREEPDKDIPAEVKQETTSTGASTPVSVKIKRIERAKKDLGPTGNKIQPTLKSFLDLKCGLEGGRGKTGLQEPDKQSRAGRDPRKADQGSCSSQLGEAGDREGSKEAGGQRCGEVGGGKEGRSQTQEQGFAAPRARPRKGKVVASLMEALEGQIARGGGRRRKRS